MSKQESRLSIAIESQEAVRNAKAVTKELEFIQAGGEKASKSVDNLGKTASSAGASVKGFGSHIESSTRALSDQIHAVDKNVLAMKNLAKIVAGYISISKGIEAADGYTQMAARIRNATISAQEYNLVQDRLLATANTTFRALSEAQEVYLSLAGGMKSLGYSTKQTLDLSDSLSFAFTANATRADQAQSAMDSLSKSMAKGKVDADAWISIVTGADNIIADMAKTTGKTETEIRQLGATGKASLEDLIKTLVATREQNEALANNMENSLKDGLQKLTNETTVFLGKLNETTKLTGHAAAAIGFLSEHIDKLAIVGGVAASIYAGRLAAAFAESAIKAGWSAAAIVTQTGAMTASATAAKSLYLALGGPVGLTIGLVGAAASMVLFSKDTDTATSSLDIQKISVAELTKEYDKLSQSKLIAHLDELNKKIADGDAKLNDAKNSITNRMKRSADYVTENTKQQQKFTEALVASMEKGLSVAKALEQVKGSKLFDESEIKGLQRQLVLYKEAKEENRLLVIQRDLANSALSKATGLYDDNATKLEKLNMESSELSKAFSSSAETTKKLAEAILVIGQESGASSEQLDVAKNAIDKFSAGSLSATQLAIELQKALPIKKETIDSFNQQAKETDGLKAETRKLNIELENENRIKANLINQHPNFLNNIKAETTEKSKQLAVEQKLNDLRKSSLEENTKNQRWINNVNAAGGGEYGVKWGNFMERWLADKKIPSSQALTAEQLKIAHEDFLVLQKRERLQSKITEAAQAQAKSDKNATKEAEEQTKELAKQAVLLAGNDERTRNMLRVYQAFRNAGLGDKQARVMTAQVGRENDFVSSAMFGSHKDRNNGYTNTGFISWQKGRSINLMKSLQGQGVLDKNGKIQQSQEALDAMAKFLMQEVSTIGAYGKTKNALQNDNLNYRELEKVVGTNFIGWDYAGKKLGSKTSAKHLKKQDDYYAKLSKILGQDPDTALGSIKNLSKYEDDAYKARAKTEEEIKQLQSQYDTDAIKRSKARDDEINKATILNQLDLIPKIKERYDAQDTLASIQFDNELNGYKWTEEQKINYHNETAKLMLDIDGKYSEKGKVALKASLDAQRDYELSAYRRLQQEKMKEFRSTLEQQTAEYQRMYYDALARASMPQPTFNRWEAQNSYSDQMGAAWDNKQNAINKADEKDSKTDQYLNDANTRYQMYLEAERNYQAQLLAIKQKGLLDEEALRTQQYSDNLSVYGAMFGGMANLMKGYVGESSGAYKTLFFMQKSFALAQAGMNVYKAASDAYANEPGTIWQKIGAATLATVESGALLTLIQAATPQGFATGGQINGKGTGTSDDIPIMASNGEYMIREFAASKLGLQTLNYINKTGELPYQRFQEQLLLQQESKNPVMQGFSTGGLVGSPQQPSSMIERQRLIAVRENIAAKQSSEPTVSIHQSITFDTSNSEAKIDTSGQKALAESLNGLMGNWFRRESMQGGEVYNVIKRLK